MSSSFTARENHRLGGFHSERPPGFSNPAMSLPHSSISAADSVGAQLVEEWKRALAAAGLMVDQTPMVFVRLDYSFGTAPQSAPAVP